MKDYFNLRKSTGWLRACPYIFALLAMMAGGVSPAWADAYTTGFESTDGWATISEMGGTDSKWSSQGYYASDYELSTTYKYQGSKGLYNAQTNSNSYYITPKLAAGTISFYAAGKKESGGSNNYVKVFKCTDNGDGTFTIDSENLSTHSYYNYSGSDYLRCNKNSLTYTEYSFELDADSHLAFLISRAGIDNFSASNGLAGAVIPNKAVDITTFTTTTPSVSANSENKYNASFSVSVKNNGSEDIVAADNVTVSLLNASDEVIVTSDAIEISKAEGSKVVTLNYEGTATTDQTVIFKVKDNFSDKTFATTAEVAVTAYGARFAIDKTSAIFGLLELNAACTPQTFEITNSGNSDLVITVGETGDAYANKTLLFSNNKNWSNVYLYAWNNDGELTSAFPGNEQTTTVGTNPEGETLYAITVPKGATKIIVSNGNGGSGNQSSDIDMDYTKTGLFLDNNFAGVFYGDGDLLVRANSKTILAVGMATTTVGVKSGSIELTYTALNGSSSTISASGVVMPAGASVVDFNDNQLPNRWTNINTYWSFANGKATGKSSSSGLLTPKLTFASGDFIVIKARRFDSDTSDYLTVKGSSDNGSTWTAYEKKLQEADGLTYPDWGYIVLSDIPTTVNKLWFVGYYAEIDEIIGLNYDQNDPQMGIYSDSECTAANKITDASVNVDFGFATTTAPAAAVYYFKNDGTGTMELTKGTDPTGLTVTLDKTSVAAGDHATLTIAMPVENNGGYHGGDIVVTATDLGTFTVKAQGVVEEDGKLNLNFATDAIPAAWAANNWTKDDAGYIKTGENGYSTTSMETTKLIAEAGEKLVVIAKNGSTTTNYKFGVKYKNADDPEAVWADLIPYTNQGTSWKTLVATITDAGNYLLQFTGYNAQIQRIYGLTKPNAPEMVVYDGNAVAGVSYSFGKVTDENDAIWTLTVKNEGEAELTGLAVALSGDNADHYTAVIADNKTTLTKNETATITVTQLKDKLGTHSATLTISAEGIDSKEIALSGETVDHTILNVDFDTSNAWPAEVLQHGANWSVYYSSYSNYGWAQQTSSSTVSSLILTPLTVNASTDILKFGAWRYSSSGSSHDLNVRYTTDGGVTWTDYDWNNYTWSAEQTLRQQLTTSEKEFEITGIPAGTVAFDFYGKYVRLDNITSDMKVAQAPLVAFTETEDNINGANLKADATATYTLANNGNANYVATVATTNVTAEVAGDGVTYEGTTLTVPAGKTATITVTMAFAEPYGEKTGSLSITSESWVGDITADYTATLVDPTNFVEDFADNDRPAGWYKDNSWYFNNQSAYVNAGTAKPLITEKIAAEASTNRNVLSFDAKKYYDYDTNAATLSVYTSTDRKDWTLRKECTLENDDDFVNFSLDALADGEYYVKFEGTNARIDNITGVKKILPEPEHDLYLVSATLPSDEITPNANYSATLNVASLRASEIVAAELYFGEDKVTELTGQTINSGATLTFQLTGTAPGAGTYDVYAKVYNDDASVETDHVSVTVADTYKLNITDFAALDASVKAAEDGSFAATFTVTVQNTGTGNIAADDVSVSLTNSANTEEVFTATWTAENSNVLYMNTEKDGTDIATDCTLKAWCWNTTEDGIWATFTKINDGFWSVDLQGKANIKICRFNPAGTDANPWNNVWNASADLSLTDGNLVKFTGYNGDAINFSSESMTMLEPTMSTTLKVTVNGTVTEDVTRSYTAKENKSNTSYSLAKSVSVIAYKTLALSEEASYEGTTTIEYDEVTLARPFIAGWNTVVLPFDIDAETFSAKFGAEAAVYKFTNNNDGELTFTKTTDGIQAGTPYLLNLPAAIADEMEFTNVTVYPYTGAYRHDANSYGAYFRGNYVAGFDMEGKYGITPQGLVKKGAAGSTMKPFRAYIEMPTGQAARIAIFDETTGISRVLTSKEIENLSIYNLNGQKVTENAKGVIIVNGKKQIVK